MVSAYGALALMLVGCNGGTIVLTQQMEARRLVSSLHVDFAKANEAAHRAVMADTDEASVAAAHEAEQAATLALQHLSQLQPVLQSLGYGDEIKILDGFKGRFAEYRTLDAEILPLAVESTNLKAQRLSFNAGQEAADSFVAALARATTGVQGAADRAQLAWVAKVAILEIQVSQARHIAEADDAAMTRIEAKMAASNAAAHDAVTRLRSRLPGAAPAWAAVTTALDQFIDINRQIVELSRRNSNVRSLALTLGRKRVVVAAAEDQLHALEEALATHAFTATR
ncbi:MAG: hypothetical protein ABL961_13250 [Vicinamibacterales bacterium]